MTSFLERIVLFFIGILMLDKNQVDYVTVCLILGVVIMEALILYFDNDIIKKIGVIAIVLLSMWQPMFVIFTPVFIYECIKNSLLWPIAVCIFIDLTTYVFVFDNNLWSKDVGSMILAICIAVAIGIRSSNEEKMKEKLHNMRDEQAYLIMKNKQSHEEIVKKQDYEIQAATLSERNRIAREIHDHVGHMLSRSILQLGALLAINKDEKFDQSLRSLKDTLDTAMNNIRESVHDLKDDSMKLEYMVRDIIKQYESLEISFDYDMGQHVSKELKYCFVAIVKEALTNTVKHSDANTVNIIMREHPAIYQVLIEDNGSKSKYAVETLKGKNGIGLENMRERVGAFGGNIRFSGDNGFKIFISIPKETEA